MSDLSNKIKDNLKEDDEFKKVYTNTVNDFKTIANNLYNTKRDNNKEKVNLYTELLNRVKELNKDKVDNFKELFEAKDPNIKDKKNIVQRLIISAALMRYLLIIKATNKKAKISGLLLLIPYYASDEEWLNVLKNETIPLMINNNII